MPFRNAIPKQSEAEDRYFETHRSLGKHWVLDVNRDRALGSESHQSKQSQTMPDNDSGAIVEVQRFFGLLGFVHISMR